ncbi:MAG: mechanosensitive ion channel family protein [Sphaerochaeta sp.]
MTKHFDVSALLQTFVDTYLIAVVVFILSSIVLLIAKRILTKKIADFKETKSANIHRLLVPSLELAQQVIIPVLFLAIISFSIGLADFNETLKHFVNVIFAVLGTIIILRAINQGLEMAFTNLLEKDPTRREQTKALKPLLSLVHLVVWILGLLALLGNLGVNVSTAIAGLGVGGIAVAVAAQGTLGDLFSYFVILFDHPFAIGDFIVFDDKNGVVEKIGIKSTQIRVLSGEILVVANSDLTASRIHNYKRMQKRMIIALHSFPFDTPAEKLERVPALITQAVNAITTIEGVSLGRTHFKAITASAYQFESVYFVPSPDYKVFMDVQQELNYHLVRIFEEAEIRFALPIYKIQEEAVQS